MKVRHFVTQLQEEEIELGQLSLKETIIAG